MMDGAGSRQTKTAAKLANNSNGAAQKGQRARGGASGAKGAGEGKPLRQNTTGSGSVIVAKCAGADTVFFSSSRERQTGEVHQPDAPYLPPGLLREGLFNELKRECSAPGVDGETWRRITGSTGEQSQQKAGGTTGGGGLYRAKAVLRKDSSAKADGRLRPSASLRWKTRIVTSAVTVLNAIYETDFLGFLVWLTGRAKGQHNALGKPCTTGLLTRKVSWVLGWRHQLVFDGLDPSMAD